MIDEETGEKRQAFADELTDGQVKFIFHAQQERERIKREKSNAGSGTNMPTSGHNF